MKRLYDYLHATMHKNETAYERYARFGKELGVSMYGVRKWLYGQRRVPDDMKIKITRLTHGAVSIEDLVRG